MVRKIAVTLEKKTVAELDRCVCEGKYPNRSHALQSALIFSLSETGTGGLHESSTSWTSATSSEWRMEFSERLLGHNIERDGLRAHLKLVAA